jgi:hypothetical protein
MANPPLLGAAVLLCAGGKSAVIAMSSNDHAAITAGCFNRAMDPSSRRP